VFATTARSRKGREWEDAPEPCVVIIAMRARQRSQCNGGEVFVTAQGEERRGEARKAGGAQNQGIGGDTPWAFSFR